jgi:hypothetical protein
MIDEASQIAVPLAADTDVAGDNSLIGPECRGRNKHRNRQGRRRGGAGSEESSSIHSLLCHGKALGESPDAEDPKLPSSGANF